MYERLYVMEDKVNTYMFHKNRFTKYIDCLNFAYQEGYEFSHQNKYGIYFIKRVG